MVQVQKTEPSLPVSKKLDGAFEQAWLFGFDRQHAPAEAPFSWPCINIERTVTNFQLVLSCQQGKSRVAMFKEGRPAARAKKRLYIGQQIFGGC